MLLTLTLLLVASPSPAESVDGKMTYIKAGRVFDGSGDALLIDRVIVVEGGRIKSVGPSADLKIPNEANVIDLSGLTVLPGRADSVGKVAPGLFADLIAVEGDPLADVSLQEHIPFVMKGGAIVNDEVKRPSPR